MIRERTFLECVETLSEQFYDKTQDEFYLRLKEQASEKLEGIRKWWRKS